jgi:eukaryotic-like serine/threonine-protein kinase
VERLLGEGATAQVWLAHDKVAGLPAAVKVVRRNLSVHRRFRARFAREVVLAAQATHQHVVPVRDFGVLEDGRQFVALAYAEAGNLKDLLARGFRVSQVLALLEQVCLALASLHARGLLHQDLKPENILLTEVDGSLHAWVADLGVADEVRQIARDSGLVAGTPTYMAPEQLSGARQEFGPWTDLYALGLILYEALAGVRPHAATGRKQLLRDRTLPPPPLKAITDLPPELHELVAVLLDPEPRQRLDRAADVRRRLGDIRRLITGDQELKVKVTSGHTELETTDPVAKALLSETSTSLGELTWNRVPPKTMPSRPPLPFQGERPSSLQLLALREIPLVAREALLQRIWDVAREVVATKSPRVVLLIGERGCGKTRLAKHIARALDEGGWMEVVRLRYQDPPGMDDGYMGAVREILVPWNDTRPALQARLARWLARDKESSVARTLDEAGVLARWCGLLLPGETAPNAGVGLHFLYKHLDMRAWRGGGCVVMDDVHLAVEPGDGLAVAEAILDQAVGQRPMLIIATLPSHALRDEGLRERLSVLEERGAVTIDVPQLSEREITSVLSEALPLDPELAATVARRVQGFPLHASMLLRECAARGLLRFDEGSRTFCLDTTLRLSSIIPADLEELYRRRLQSAVEATEDPAEAGEALAAMALTSQEPPVEVIREVAEQGLELLLATGLVHQERGLVRFEDRALKEVARKLAEDLPTQAVLHAGLAQAWANLSKSTGADVDLPLGLHRLKSGRPDKAIGPLLSCVRGMIHQGRYTAALQAAELAVIAADRSATRNHAALPNRLEARRLKAVALVELDRPEEAAAMAEEAGDLGWGDRLIRTRLTVVKARAASEMGKIEQARRLLGSAHGSFWAMRDNQGLAEVAACRAALARRENRLHAAIEQYEEALRMRPEPDRLGVDALSGIVHICLQQGRPVDARPMVARLARAARETGDTRFTAQASFAAGNVMLAEGRLKEAARHFQTAQAAAATSGDYRMQLNALNSLGEVARYRGDSETAQGLYTVYTRLAHARGYALLEAVGWLNLALIALGQTKPGRADLHARRASQAMARSPRSWVWMYVGLIRAACAASAGDQDKTDQWWRLAVDHGLRNLRSPDLWVPLSIVAESSKAQGWHELEDQSWALLATVKRA